MRWGSLAGLFVLACVLNVASQNAPKNGGDFAGSPPANLPPGSKVPKNVILIKGAWSSASDSTTPVPDGGRVEDGFFRDDYFRIAYPVPRGLTETYQGPPPSESGRYVLAQLGVPDTFKGENPGHILVTADDLFFTPFPVKDVLQLTAYEKDNLQADYKLELPPTQTKIAGQPFTFYAYWSPAAELHWYVLSTEIRCHAVEFVMTSRNTKTLQSWVMEMGNMSLPAETNLTGNATGGDFPVCVKDYADGENVLNRVDPVFSEHKFNPVPVRLIIDKTGTIKHVHFLSAFPDQEKAITEAFKQWKFRPYVVAGKPVEVETGIMFGRAAHPLQPAASTAVE